MNRFVFTCRLTADPEIRYSESGTAVARFGVAVQRIPKREGEPDADFFSCVAFGKTAENFDKLHIGKGVKLLIEGEMRNNNFTDRNGVERKENRVYVNTFEFCESKASQTVQAQPIQQYQPRPTAQQYTPETQSNDGFMTIPDNVADEGLPFN